MLVSVSVETGLVFKDVFLKDFGFLVFGFQTLQEDIKLRRQNVDQAIANGMELLKQTTGKSPPRLTALPRVNIHNDEYVIKK